MLHKPDYFLFLLAFELISLPFQKNLNNLKALHLPKDFFPVAVALTTKMGRDSVPEKFQTSTVYLIYIFILVQVIYTALPCCC